MDWSNSDLFIRVCEIATRECNSYVDRINKLIPLVEAFTDHDFDTLDECFDDVKDLKDATRLVFPDDDWD